MSDTQRRARELRDKIKRAQWVLAQPPEVEATINAKWEAEKAEIDRQLNAHNAEFNYAMDGVSKMIDAFMAPKPAEPTAAAVKDDEAQTAGVTDPEPPAARSYGQKLSSLLHGSKEPKRT